MHRVQGEVERRVSIAERAFEGMLLRQGTKQQAGQQGSRRKMGSSTEEVNSCACCGLLIYGLAAQSCLLLV